MRLEVWLGIVTVAMTVLGGIVSIFPPVKPWKKPVCAVAFIVFGVVSVWLTVKIKQPSADELANAIIRKLPAPKGASSSVPAPQAPVATHNADIAEEVANLVARKLSKSNLRVVQTSPPPAASPVSTTKPMRPVEPAIVPNNPELKTNALQLAKEMKDWLALLSPDIPAWPPKTAEEEKKAQEFRERLDSEWGDFFSKRAIDTWSSLSEAHAVSGVDHACFIQQIDLRSDIELRKLCATEIENGALKLKD